MNTRHVILLTYGEPPDPGFFAQLRYSWRILLGLTRSVATIPAPLLPIIALSRARLRTSTWRAERYASPLEAITVEQAGALARLLAAREPETSWRVHVAYEFRDPLLTVVLDAIPAREPVEVIPMYVADSAFTHALSRATLEAWLARRFPAGRPASARVLPPLGEEPLAAISARHVLDELARLGLAPDREWALMLAAHGTLLEPPRPYETGRLATERVCAGIARRLNKVPFDQISIRLLSTMSSLDQTLKSTDQLMRHVDGSLAPQIEATLAEAQAAMKNAKDVLGKDAPLQSDLGETLLQLSRAAKAVTELVDYLERHPESLLRGKRGDSP